MPALFEIDGRWWREFNRQLKAAAGDASDIKDMWARILEPMRADWARRIPSSRLKRTVKVRRKAQGEIWAGYKSKPREGQSKPFLPWLEFGGTIRFKPGPMKKGERVPMGGDFRTVYSIHRERDKEGRYMGPAVATQSDDIAEKFAEGVAEIFDKHFR